jgi:Fe-S-cluster containining protein
MAPPDAPDRDDLHDPMPLGPHHVAGIWRALLPEDAEWLRMPPERYAECSTCPPAVRGEYHADCRCCGYVPHVPNISLGLALEDPDAAPRIRAAIGARLALPSGLWASPARFRRSMAMDSGGKFGTDPSMACPFLGAGGGCGIHAYRNSVCSTFFCVNDHGEAGERLWNSMQALLGNTEVAAAQWAMGEAGLSWELQAERMNELAGDMDALSTDDESWTEAAHRHIWGDWLGREQAFYARCIAAVRAHRDGLFERLASRVTPDAVAFEVAQRDWVPIEHRDEVPLIAGDGVDRANIQDLWYRIQLRLRNIWALPLNEGPVRWAAGIQIAPPDGRLPLLVGDKNRVAGASRIYWVDDVELALLELFKIPRPIDSALLDSAEADAVDDARGFLSMCMRRGILELETAPTA